MDFRIERLISKIKSAKRRDVALFVGSFVLFFVLSFGMIGFIAKAVIQKMWGI